MWRRSSIAQAFIFLLVSSEAVAVARNVEHSPFRTRRAAFVGAPAAARNHRDMRMNSAEKALGMGVGIGLGMLVTGSMPIAAQAVEDLQAPPEPPAQLANRQPGKLRYSEFLDAVEKDTIEKVSFTSDGKTLTAIDTDGNRIKIDALPSDPALLKLLARHNVDVSVVPVQEGGVQNIGPLAFISNWIIPLTFFLGIIFLARRRDGGASGPQGPGRGMGPGMRGMGPQDFSKSQSNIQLQPNTGVKFDDVAGCNNAKMELVEVVDFLKNPERYTKMGAKIPRGVLMDGPPGTGKTMLAKAVAGEAGVPFINCVGSQFVEVYVGVGASRIRDLFDTAKKNAPCIIFIDEIDAVGRQRGSSMMGGNDEREQTLNQLLTEMDGFNGNPGVIVIAATNRADILDEALVRPGRFDRKVTVDLPDFQGRTAILKVHAKERPLNDDVDLESIARRTPGFSGAQLQNLLNEAAIFAARRDDTKITWEDVDRALDKLMVGLESPVEGDPEQQELVAYHEAGHAIVGALLPDYDQVQKVTIIPRSNGAGGLTFFAPSDKRLDGGMYSKQYLESQLAVALGGRLAEELIYGEEEVTTGASNDIQQVSNIAHAMVCEYGMSKKIGPIFIDEEDMMNEEGADWSDEVWETVDEEVQRLVSNAYVLCKKILQDNIELLHALAMRLLEQETIGAEELQLMLWEYDAQMAPYGLFPDNVDRSKYYPYQGKTVMPRFIYDFPEVRKPPFAPIARYLLDTGSPPPAPHEYDGLKKPLPNVFDPNDDPLAAVV